MTACVPTSTSISPAARAWPILSFSARGTLPVNKATLTEEGVQIEFPHSNQACMQCGNCKQTHLSRLRLKYERAIYIGDGYSDRCPAMVSDIVFAKNHLATIFDEAELPYVPFESFADVIAATLG